MYPLYNNKKKEWESWVLICKFKSKGFMMKPQFHLVFNALGKNFFCQQTSLFSSAIPTSCVLFFLNFKF
jgi:hypothetical protein